MTSRNIPAGGEQVHDGAGVAEVSRWLPQCCQQTAPYGLLAGRHASLRGDAVSPAGRLHRGVVSRVNRRGEADVREEGVPVFSGRRSPGLGPDSSDPVGRMGEPTGSGRSVKPVTG